MTVVMPNSLAAVGTLLGPQPAMTDVRSTTAVVVQTTTDGLDRFTAHDEPAWAGMAILNHPERHCCGAWGDARPLGDHRRPV